MAASIADLPLMSGDDEGQFKSSLRESHNINNHIKHKESISTLNVPLRSFAEILNISV